MVAPPPTGDCAVNLSCEPIVSSFGGSLVPLVARQVSLVGIHFTPRQCTGVGVWKCIEEYVLLWLIGCDN